MEPINIYTRTKKVFYGDRYAWQGYIKFNNDYLGCRWSGIYRLTREDAMADANDMKQFLLETNKVQ